jgi:hypothetical protein
MSFSYYYVFFFLGWLIFLAAIVNKNNVFLIEVWSWGVYALKWALTGLGILRGPDKAQHGQKHVQDKQECRMQTIMNNRPAEIVSRLRSSRALWSTCLSRSVSCVGLETSNPSVHTAGHGNLETVAMGWFNERVRRCATMDPARDCANRDTSVYPGSGPSTPEVKPLLPALFCIISTVITTLLELFGLEEEEEDRISLV